MILNARNQILVGRRLDHPSGYWQMPQGGIDQNENPEEAVWREMLEEIGTKNAIMIKESKKWINYDIPKETLAKLPSLEELLAKIVGYITAPHQQLISVLNAPATETAGVIENYSKKK